MEYKGYTAGPIDFDPEEETFSGVVLGLKDVIHFEGASAAELLSSFESGIDDYLDDLDDIRVYDRAKAGPPQEFVPAAIADRRRAPDQGLA
ncbi:MAG TPA: hypothetical protein VNT30_23290 [Stellaceae bacterium]|nr:hypothetical protein [Stellaceae bacterium]